MSEARPTLVDLFCAAGGTTRGFSFRPEVFPAFRPVLAIDKDPWGLRSYRENFPEARTVRTDLASLDDRSAWSLARECGLRTGELDCLVASPPCETFSSNTKWRVDERDERNFLFRAVLRWVQVLRPKTILVENVPGFRTMGDGLYHSELLERLTEWGYAVEWDKVNAVEHCVPQMRQRLFYLAYRNDVGNPQIPHVDGHPQVTSRQAIGDLPPRVNGGGPDSFVSRIVPGRTHRLGAFAAAMRPQAPGATIRHHSAGVMSSTNIKRLRSMKPGNPMDSLPARLQPKMGYRRAYGRLDPNRPAFTLTGNFGGISRGPYGHYNQLRGLTLREGARLQSFPDEHVFYGPGREHLAFLIGSAVPPLVARAFALEVGRTLNLNGSSHDLLLDLLRDP